MQKAIRELNHCVIKKLISLYNYYKENKKYLYIMEYQFEFKLQRLAITSVAESLWNQPDIQCKLKRYFYPYYRGDKNKWLSQLTDEVIQKIDPLSLPAILHHELVLAVKRMGNIMNNWFYYLRRRKIFRDMSRQQIHDKLFKDICWTYYGSIDEVKILRASWLNNPSLDLMKIYVMACNNCCEDVIRQLWKRIPKKKMIPFAELCSRHGYHMTAYWNKVLENNLDEFVRDVIVADAGQVEGDDEDDVKAFSYVENSSLEKNMLWLAVWKRYVPAVKYFWDKITDKEKQESIQSMLWYCIEELTRYYSQCYRTDQSIQIIMYLLNFATEKTLEAVFTKTDNSGVREHTLGLFLNFIIDWPFQEFFDLLMPRVLQYLNGREIDQLVDLLLKQISSDSMFQNLHRKRLHFICSRASISVMKTVANKIYWKNLFSDELPTLKLLLTDKTELQIDEAVIRNIKWKWTRAVEESESKTLQLIIDEFLISKKWSLEKQKTISQIYTYLMKSEFTLAKNLLENNSDELRNEINHTFMCFYFVIKHDYRSADEFLKWKFQKTEEIDTFKIEFCNEDSGFVWRGKFVEHHLGKIWETDKNSVEMAKTNSQNFLLWFLKTEEEVMKYKTENLKSILFSGDYHKLLSIFHFEVFEDFFSWCHLSRCAFKKMQNEMIITPQSLWQSCLSHSMRQGDFAKSEKFLTWLFDSQEERSNHMKKFLMSDEALLAIKMYVTKYSAPQGLNEPKPTKEDLEKKFQEFINFFIKPYIENIDGLKRTLKGWPKISKRIHEEIRDDSPSTEPGFTDGSDSINMLHFEVFCDFERYEIFFKELDRLKVEE